MGPGKVQVQDIDDPVFAAPDGRRIEHAVILKVLSTYIWGQWHGGGLGDAAAIAIMMIAVMAPLVTTFWIYARKQQHVASAT
jgi:hypothetical protein